MSVGAGFIRPVRGFRYACRGSIYRTRLYGLRTKMIKKIKLLSLMLFLCVVSSGFAQEVNNAIKVKSALDKKTASIGDYIKYEITLVAPRTAEFDFSEVAKGLKKLKSQQGSQEAKEEASEEKSDSPALSIKDSGLFRKGIFKKKRFTQWYKFSTYSVGKYIIPEFIVKYKDSLNSAILSLKIPAQEFEIKSLLEKDSKDIKDIKGPISPAEKFKKFLLMLAAFLILSGAVWLSLRFWRRKQKEYASRVKPAWEFAYQMLEELRLLDYPGRGKVKEYYFELSYIVRHYLEDRFNLRAPEMTTEEFLAKVGDYAELNSEVRSVLKDFLISCDMVKFAKYAPPREEIDLSFNLAKQIIDKTIPAYQPLPTA